jgi:hypothetical protein
MSGETGRKRMLRKMQTLQTPLRRRESNRLERIGETL